MKRFSLLLTALLLSLFTWADIPAGYAIYGDVPAGFVDLTSAIEVHNTSETFSQSPSNTLEYSNPDSPITFTGNGTNNHICDGRAGLLIRFKENQQLSLTEDMSIHVLIKRTTNGRNAAQMSFCQNRWNDHRMGWTIAADHLSQTNFTEIIFTYAARELNNYQSYSESSMIGTNVTYHGGTFMSESRDLFRFCGANGEGFEIAMIFITNSSPKVQSSGLGTLKAKSLPMFAESSTWQPTGTTIDNINLYVVSMGNQVLARITPTGHQFDSGFTDRYQFRTYKISHERNQSVNCSSRKLEEVLFEISNGLFGIGENADGMVCVRAQVWGQNSPLCSQKLPFRGTYVNTPTGDQTAPTLSQVDQTKDGETISLSFTASDDSGDMFYYVENTTKSTKQVSMIPDFVLAGAQLGDVLNCYAVDFDGNMSAPQAITVREPACDNCFPVTF